MKGQPTEWKNMFTNDKGLISKMYEELILLNRKAHTHKNQVKKWAENHRYVNYPIGNMVNNMAITMYGVWCVLKISWGTLCKVYDCLTTMLFT